MSIDEDAFTAQIMADGSVRIGGRAAAIVLFRIALASKFQRELNAEFLLSPLVNQLIDTLVAVVPIVPIDWSNPSTLTPPEFLEAVDVVRSFRERHEPNADLLAMVQEALKPYSVPLTRLGIG